MAFLALHRDRMFAHYLPMLALSFSMIENRSAIRRVAGNEDLNTTLQHRRRDVTR
jgi:hypothetical protein